MAEDVVLVEVEGEIGAEVDTIMEIIRGIIKETIKVYKIKGIKLP